MKTVGAILRDARKNRQLSISDVEAGTKIRAKFLEAIEADKFQLMPSLSYAKGFVKNYSEFIGLDSRTVLAFFRRQTTETTKTSLLPKRTPDALNRSRFQLTPSRFILLLVIGLVGIFFLYLGYQYRSFQKPPTLTIESPKNQAIVTEKRIELLGKTDPDATITINGVSVLVRADGKFFDQIALEPGVNKISITATSRLGKETTIIHEVGLK